MMGAILTRITTFPDTTKVKNFFDVETLFHLKIIVTDGAVEGSLEAERAEVGVEQTRIQDVLESVLGFGLTLFLFFMPKFIWMLSALVFVRADPNTNVRLVTSILPLMYSWYGMALVWFDYLLDFGQQMEEDFYDEMKDDCWVRSIEDTTEEDDQGEAIEDKEEPRELSRKRNRNTCKDEDHKRIADDNVSAEEKVEDDILEKAHKDNSQEKVYDTDKVPSAKEWEEEDDTGKWEEEDDDTGEWEEEDEDDDVYYIYDGPRYEDDIDYFPLNLYLFMTMMPVVLNSLVYTAVMWDYFYPPDSPRSRAAISAAFLVLKSKVALLIQN